MIPLIIILFFSIASAEFVARADAAAKDGERPVPVVARGHGTGRPAGSRWGAAHDADHEPHGPGDDGRRWQSDDPAADDARRK